jgi:hypothetical protein
MSEFSDLVLHQARQTDIDEGPTVSLLCLMKDDQVRGWDKVQAYVIVRPIIFLGIISLRHDLAFILFFGTHPSPYTVSSLGPTRFTFPLLLAVLTIVLLVLLHRDLRQ